MERDLVQKWVLLLFILVLIAFHSHSQNIPNIDRIVSIDSTIVGTRMKKVFNQMAFDSTNCRIIQEPKGILQGLSYRNGTDSILLYITTKRVFYMERPQTWDNKYRRIKNRKVIGFCMYYKGEFSGYGETIWYCN